MKKFTYLLVAMIVTLGLVACNSEDTLTNKEQEAEAQQIDSAKATSNKEDIIEQLNVLDEDFKRKVLKVGWLTAKEYAELKGNVNLTAIAANSSAEIEFNDAEHIGEIIVKLKEDIEALSDEDVLNTYENINSSKYIYNAKLKDDLHVLMKYIDPDGEHNRLDQFVFLYGDSTSSDEIIEEAKWYIERTQEYEHETIKLLTAIVENNNTYFNEDDLEKLNVVLQYLQSSIDKQLSIFQEFSYITIDDGITISEKAESALIDFKLAESSLHELEVNLE